jgi:hypothetical protein
MTIAADTRQANDARVAANQRRLMRGYRIAPGADQAFRDLILDCRDAGTHLVIVRTPESGSLRAAYPPEAVAALTEYQDQLRREFGVTVVDATAWLLDDQFSDGHHPLTSGQTIFTDRLHRDVLIPLVAGKHSGLKTR